MTITVAAETPLQDDVRGLVADLNAHVVSLSPPEYQFKMTIEEMAGADTTVFVARTDNGTAVGTGALRQHADNMGEVKRMYTLPELRGNRVGQFLLDAIVDRARADGITHLVLETGVGEGFEGAHRLYRRYGLQPCGPVLDYPENPWSAFYEMHLTSISA